MYEAWRKIDYRDRPLVFFLGRQERKEFEEWAAGMVWKPAESKEVLFCGRPVVYVDQENYLAAGELFHVERKE